MKGTKTLFFGAFGLLIPLVFYTQIARWLLNISDKLGMAKGETHFRTTQKYKVDYSPHSLVEYVSDRTGLRVVVVDQKGPKVFGTFAAATEIFDDSGCPHTLEHVIFMGSRSYPYKGILDQLATRFYSTTNAWTSTDHTAYTLETAGYAAFAEILPIYLEHVILPTLTDSACYTEVFHIDPTGHDTGVVYSEMQAVQNTKEEVMELEGKRLLYGDGIGFRYETGGMMDKLRVLSTERIRQFHRDMYQPKNLCLVIIGEVDHAHLLQTLETFESSIIDAIPRPSDPFKRPWTESKQPSSLNETVTKSIEFPDEDESVGEISIRYFGPSCNDVVQYTAMNVLLAYLASSSASVLENVLVEKEQICTAVYYSNTPRPNSVIEFDLTGVDSSKLQVVADRFFELLDQVAKEELDMPYLTNCLNRERRQEIFNAENSEQPFVTSVISTFLFSPDRNLSDMTTLSEYETLTKWTETDWRDFLKKWIVDAKRVTILGKPSGTLAKKIEEDEKNRVEKQIEKLGKEGLEELDNKLKKAREENDRPIPQDLLAGLKVPQTDTIHFVTSTPARSGRARDAEQFNNDIQTIIDKENSNSELFLHFEDIPSSFASIFLVIGTEAIPVHLRPLLTIYIHNFFSTPVIRHGTRLEFEDAIKALETDTVAYGISSAERFGNKEAGLVYLHVNVENYHLAIEWFRDLIWNSPFEIDRLKSITSRLLQDIPDEKRSGSDMVEAVSHMVQDKPESLTRADSTLVKALYLKHVRKLLKTDPDTIIKQMEEIRAIVGEVTNMRVFVVSDVNKLKEPVNAWKALTVDQDFNKPLSAIDSRIDRLTEIGRNPGNHAYITPMSAIDSSFTMAVTRGPDDAKDSRVPALMVAISYLDATEGPMWTSVRGAGLAYGTYFQRRPGHIEFIVYRSPDAFKAFKASKQVIEDYISEERVLDDLSMEGAISGIVLSIASGQSTMIHAAVDNVVRTVMKDLPRDWNNILLEKVRNVSKEDVIKAMKDMLLPVFQPKTSNLFVTCATIMEQGLVDGFKELGYGPEVRTLASFQDDYGTGAGDDVDETSSQEGSEAESDGESRSEGSDMEEDSS